MPTEVTSGIYDPDLAPDGRTYLLVLQTCCRVKSAKAIEVALKVLDEAREKGLLLKSGVSGNILKAVNNSQNMVERAKLTAHVCTVILQEHPELLKKNFGRLARKQFSYFRNVHPQLYEEWLSELDVKYRLSGEDEGDSDLDEEGDTDTTLQEDIKSY
jgi:hypothetical protein